MLKGKTPNSRSIGKEKDEKGIHYIMEATRTKIENLLNTKRNIKKKREEKYIKKSKYFTT